MSKRYAILIIEDEKNMSSILCDRFELEGFLVDKAFNGMTGLAKALDNHPDIILLDIAMPKMDGITMMKKLRKTVWGKTVPIVFLTNLEQDIDTITQYSNGASLEYMVKVNCRLDDIVKKVRETLD